MTERVRAAKRARLETAAQLRAVIYARVSKPGEKSVKDQEKVGRRDLASIGVVVVAVFSDKLSASRYRRVQERPGFIETKDFISAGKAEMLWTFANNRAARDLDDYVPLRRLCIETGTLWRYGNRTYDLSKAADRRAANADALRAEEQSDDISENVNRGVQEALEEGKPHGKLPAGYRIIRDEETGKAINREPIPAQAEIIRLAAQRVLDHESLRSVSADLAPRWAAAKGKGTFDARSLRRLLINPTYAGMRTYYGKISGPGTWEPIITPDQHKRLRSALMHPQRVTSRSTEPVHLLSFIARCGVCQTHMQAKTPSPGGPKTKPYYCCPQWHLSRAIERVDGHVEELLMQLFERPDTLALFAASATKDEISVEDELATIVQLRADIEAYVKDAARTRMSATAVSTYVEELERQIREAQGRIDAVAAAADPLVAESVGPNARSVWARRDLREKRDVIRRSIAVRINRVGSRGVHSEIGVEVRPLFAAP
ncbi:recombinase family protein [Nocardia sp. CY41]|uniref:recombinase family protein n=1 Tax=Nocardia sp. CY41 TaxID=2608686 RepID=UPI00135CA553|nr:recombinase family protein [Nocardia sp. CY41]